MLTQDFLTRRAWRYEWTDGETIAPHLLLHAKDRFGGRRGASFWRWSIHNGLLAFQDWHGRVSTLFGLPQETPAGRWTFEGLSRFDLGRRQRLVEVEPLSQISPIDPGLEIVRRTAAPRRRNLVVLRANEDSLHPHWRADILPAERSWDLCLSFYGKPENFPIDDHSDYQVIQNQDRKFQALYKLFHENSQFWDYEYIMFPDDDLMMSWMDINNVFEIALEHRLELAQPALTRDSYFGPEITLQQPGILLRFTTYVEGMIPVFSRDALRTCIPTFRRALLGWGVDCLWPSLLGSHAARVGIIDFVAVRHTRPVGHNYHGYDVAAEGRELLRLYGIHFHPRVIGHLDLA